ncbi:unnamed protein product, partial [Owenia fusiformis]
MAQANLQMYTLENRNVLKKLAVMRNTGQLCDLRFLFPDGSQILAHKAIVCQYSSFIAARCVDIDQHLLTIISTEIDDEQEIESQSLDIILDYIYGLSVQIRQGEIKEVMRLAIKLNIPEFLTDCDQMLFENKPDSMHSIKQEQSTVGYDQHRATYDQQRTEYDQQSSAYDQHSTSYEGQVSDYEAANQSIATPSTSFQESPYTSFDPSNIEQMKSESGSMKRKGDAAESKDGDWKKAKEEVGAKYEPQSGSDDDEHDNIEEDNDDFDGDTDEYEAERIVGAKQEEVRPEADDGEVDVDQKAKEAEVGVITIKKKKKKKKKPKIKPEEETPKPKEKRRHVRSIPDALICKDCDTKFETYAIAAEHQKTIHNVIVCDICAKKFENEADLRRHNVLHADGTLYVNNAGKLVFRCAVCPEEFPVLPRLKNHSRD